MGIDLRHPVISGFGLLGLVSICNGAHFELVLEYRDFSHSPSATVVLEVDSLPVSDGPQPVSFVRSLTFHDSFPEIAEPAVFLGSAHDEVQNLFRAGSGGIVRLTTEIPEPNNFGLALLGILVLVAFRGRRGG